MADPMLLIGSALLVVSALLAVACVVSQALLARWWETPAGRHVMAFQSVLAAVLTLWALRVWIPDASVLVAARMVAFMGVPIVLAWRLSIILHTWRSKRRKQAK